MHKISQKMLITNGTANIRRLESQVSNFQAICQYFCREKSLIVLIITKNYTSNNKENLIVLEVS